MPKSKAFLANQLLVTLLTILLLGGSVLPLKAEDYTSTNFILRDPVMSIEAGRATSASFQYFSSTGQTAPGQSTSSTFIGRGGFLYFPTITSPVISVTTGNGQVSLSWSAASTALGLSVASYNVGQATSAGGPYTFTNVGSALSLIKTGLTNGVTYYFVVRALDSGGNLLVTSAEVSVTPSAPVAPPPPASGGGGGGGGTISPPSLTTSVIFSGRAYPLSTVTLLKDGQIAVQTIAGGDANFQASLSDLSGGSYIFSVYGEDYQGNRSAILTFSISLTRGSSTKIGGIFLAPTLSVDKSEVKRGENIAIFGQSVPTSEITIAVNSDNETFVKTAADKNGTYLYNFDTSPLEQGQHFTKSKAAISGEISSFGKTLSFSVGSKTVPASSKCGKADINCDGRVNLIDFSITAFWYKRTLSEDFKVLEKDRLNGDGKVDLVDFSIMAFYWTG